MESNSKRRGVVTTKLELPEEWKKTTLLTGLACIASLVITLRMHERGTRIDWDVDTFIAISQSWLKGNHLYLDFFDPKWPHIQALYIPAAITKSVLVHLATSWLTLAGTGIVISLIALQRNKARKGSLAICAGSLYILLAPLLPGGNIGHLEIYSNFFAALSVYLATSVASNKRAGRVGLGLITLSGFCAGFSCGVRPNLIIPVLMLLAGVLYYSRYLFGKVQMGVALAIGTVAGLTLPFYPYLLIDDGIAKAWSGVVEILRPWKEAMYSNYSIGTFTSELFTMINPRIFGVGFSIVYIPLLLLSTIAAQRCSARKRIVAIVLVIFWLSGLYMSYWVSHIHHHYLLMDFMGICIILAFAEAKLSRVLHRALVVLSFILCFSIAVYPLKAASSVDIQRIEEERVAVTYINNNQSISFAAPEWVSLHWRGGQPIRTTGIHPVWSIQAAESPMIRGLEASKRLSLTNDLEKNCKIWTSTSIDAVFMSLRLSERCNLPENSEWTDETTNNGFPLGSSIRLFVRQKESVQSLRMTAN